MLLLRIIVFGLKHLEVEFAKWLIDSLRLRLSLQKKICPMPPGSNAYVIISSLSLSFFRRKLLTWFVWPKYLHPTLVPRFTVPTSAPSNGLYAEFIAHISSCITWNDTRTLFWIWIFDFNKIRSIMSFHFFFKFWMLLRRLNFSHTFFGLNIKGENQWK